MWSITSGFKRSKSESTDCPAFAIAKSTRPNAPSVCSTNPLTACCSATSPVSTKHFASGLASVHAAAVSSSALRSRPTSATFAPCFARSTAIARPIPRLAPVISAAFSSNIDHFQNGAEFFDACKVGDVHHRWSAGQPPEHRCEHRRCAEFDDEIQVVLEHLHSAIVPAHLIGDRTHEIVLDGFRVAIRLSIDV